MNHLFSRRLWIASACIAAFSFAAPASAADDARTFELRIYTTNEGKLPDLLARFRDHTCKLFEKHGMENIGYWVPTEDADGAKNKLIYVIAHQSRDAAKASWAAFQSDPDWRAAAKASEANGKILAMKPESVFMTATDYSCAIKPSANGDRVFEMRTYTTPEGKLDALHKRFREHTVALFTKHGMTHIGYWSPTDAETGAGTKLIYILAHASKEAATASFTAFRADPEWIAAKAESEKDGSLTIKDGGVKSVFMKATDFSPIK
jgi:hypothetical protein